MKRFFPFPPYVPQGGRGCSSLPSQSTLGSYGVLREAQRGATPPDNDRFQAFRFIGTSLRNTEQRLWDVYHGSSHAGEGLLVECGLRKLCFRP